MDSAPTRIQERISVGGIKLSPELVQFTYTRPATEKCFLAPALAAIAGKQINITFLSLSASAGNISVSLCVEAENHLVVKGALDAVINDSQHLQCIPSVGTLTVFPHRNSLTLLGRVIRSFAVNTLPVYGLCTSVSALSVNTAFSSLEDGIRALENIVELPYNHSPFRQEYNIRQVNL